MPWLAASASAILFLNAGIHRIGAAKASIINMLEPVVTMFASPIVLQDRSDGFHFAWKRICRFLCW
ncbi:EamA family transporter [uncultured Oscillibacter sp.]|uniref:EamA family transporter n=1 Tax=uncultured Oscillibacter sp. TaxID=876091 RepID=UPI0034239672